MHSTSVPTIRAAVPGDHARVATLLTANALPLDGLPASLDGFVVAEDGDALVGVAGLEPCGDDALLRSVAVDVSRRGHGLGHALVTRVLAEAAHRRIDTLYLLTTTAERWFPSFGFTTITRADVPDALRATAEFRGACPASATVMMRRARRDGAAAHDAAARRVGE